MQISRAFPDAAPPSSGGAAEIANQIRLERMRHRANFLSRTLRMRWYLPVFALLGGIISAYLGQAVFAQPKIVIGALVGLPIIVLAIRHSQFGALLFAACVTPFVPSALKVATLYISPAVPILVLLFFIVLWQNAFRIREFVFPSLRTIWPLIGLILMAIIAEVVGQITWLDGVQHRVLNNPIAFEEGIGLALYCMPLLVVFTISGTISGKDSWIKYILHTFLFMALLDAAVIIVEYKHIGADIYAFRYTSPSIGWMPLEALAQLLVLGCIVGYAYCLHATRWKPRILYGMAMAMCLLALYLSLENSWWLEGAVALMVMTVAYSRRLFIAACVAGLPLIPLVKSFLQKLESVKSVDALRLVIWQDMLRVWSKRPILGVGPGNLWAYDQAFTHLPQGLRNFGLSGLGVAHEGYLQTLGELGPLGLFCQVSFIVIMIITAARLFRRSRALSTPEMRDERILGLIGLGLICGSAAGDFVASYFFLPPRQSLHVGSLPQALVSWTVYSCVLYKDQLWRNARKAMKFIER